MVYQTLLLPSVTKFSLIAAVERYADCARAMGIANSDDSDDVANDKLLIELESLNTDLNVPSPEGFGINKDDFMSKLEIMAEQAITASALSGNNPRVPNNDEIIEIYKTLW